MERAFTLNIYFPENIRVSDSTKDGVLANLTLYPPEHDKRNDVITLNFDKESFPDFNFNKVVKSLVDEIERLGLGLSVEDVELDKAAKQGFLIFKHDA